MDIDTLKKKKISAISLGCDKNRVDLEKMLFNLKNFGFEIIDDINQAEIVIVNTCAFISSAVKEAIDNILMAEKLKENLCEKVIVTGCLPNRYKEEIYNLLKEVDLFLEVKNNENIVQEILKLYNLDSKYEYKNGRLLTNMPHYAYLKIADGCDNGCAYCTIPRIRGRYKSASIDNLIKEAKDLACKGVKELILVAQDITRYGIDLYNKYKLVDLIKELSKIKGIEWIRLHYCYPEMITKELLDEIKNNEKVCKYIDMPLQHIDNDILKEMNRRSTEQSIRDLIKDIRENYPEIAIRSTFIIGFPGETKNQFKKLLEFLKDAKIENVGFFPYYKEEKTKAYFMKKQVPNFIKKLRLKKAQKVQKNIMDTINLSKIGQDFNVIIDSFDDQTGMYLARTNQSSPNVDFTILVEDNNHLSTGKIVKVKIKDYISSLFIGEYVDEYTK